MATPLQTFKMVRKNNMKRFPLFVQGQTNSLSLLLQNGKSLDSMMGIFFLV